MLRYRHFWCSVFLLIACAAAGLVEKRYRRYKRLKLPLDGERVLRQSATGATRPRKEKVSGGLEKSQKRYKRERERGEGVVVRP